MQKPAHRVQTRGQDAPLLLPLLCGWPRSGHLRVSLLLRCISCAQQTNVSHDKFNQPHIPFLLSSSLSSISLHNSKYNHAQPRKTLHRHLRPNMGHSPLPPQPAPPLTHTHTCHPTQHPRPRWPLATLHRPHTHRFTLCLPDAQRARKPRDPPALRSRHPLPHAHHHGPPVLQLRSEFLLLRAQVRG